jgi:DTW domain-containing protein YfiP
LHRGLAFRARISYVSGWNDRPGAGMQDPPIATATPIPAAEAAAAGAVPCARCGKPAALCVCDGIVPIANRVALLILQHPQEQDEALGTARLTALHFRDAVFRVGLSWPSLAKALGREADPRHWAVLYLGAAPAAAPAAATVPPREITLLDGKGKPLPDQAAGLREIEGIVLLDGTWSQAKTLWWRNAWVLKARRVVLAPARPSHYGRLRREPRREGLSTLEAAGLLLARLENRPEIETGLLASFDRLLDRYRAARPAPPPRRDRRHAHRS